MLFPLRVRGWPSLFVATGLTWEMCSVSFPFPLSVPSFPTPHHPSPTRPAICCPSFRYSLTPHPIPHPSLTPLSSHLLRFSPLLPPLLFFPPPFPSPLPVPPAPCAREARGRRQMAVAHLWGNLGALVRSFGGPCWSSLGPLLLRVFLLLGTSVLPPSPSCPSSWPPPCSLVVVWSGVLVLSSPTLPPCSTRPLGSPLRPPLRAPLAPH